MSTRKKCLSAFLIVIAALCLFAMHFVPERAETVYATNSKNYKGTYTDDEWNGTQTTNNLITIGISCLIASSVLDIFMLTNTKTCI